MTKDRCRCRCTLQKQGNYCVSNVQTSFKGIYRGSGNVGVYDVFNFKIRADVEKCWTGNAPDGEHDGVFINLSGVNLGPNTEPTVILPLTGISLSQVLETEDGEQGQTTFSRDISYVFSGVEVDAAVPHNQAYAVDWEVNAGSGEFQSASWYNETGDSVSIPPCSTWGRIVGIYPVPEGETSGIVDTSLPLSPGATNTNWIGVSDKSISNQSGYPEQPGRLSPAEMGTGVAGGSLLDPQPSGYADFPESLEIVAGQAFDAGTNTINEDDVVTLTRTAGSDLGLVYYAEDPSESDEISATNRIVIGYISKLVSTGPSTVAPAVYIDLEAQPNGKAQFGRVNGPLLTDEIYNFKEMLSNNYAAGGAKASQFGNWSNFSFSNGSDTAYGDNIFKSLVGVPTATTVVELITNNRFVNGNLLPWVVDEPSCSVSEGPDYTLVCSDNLGSNPNPRVQQTFDVESGATYRVSYEAKSSNGGTVELTIGGVTTSDIVLSTFFQSRVVDVTATASNSLGIVIGSEAGSFKSVTFDKISVLRIA